MRSTREKLKYGSRLPLIRIIMSVNNDHHDLLSDQLAHSPCAHTSPMGSKWEQKIMMEHEALLERDDKSVRPPAEDPSVQQQGSTDKSFPGSHALTGGKGECDPCQPPP